MKTFKEFLNEDMIDYICITIDTNILEKMELLPINESIWRPSKVNGWSYRVDGEHPQMKQQRHVHVAKSKDINAKSNQFSWNKDGSRHDKLTFSKSEKGIETAKQIAGATLGIQSTVFESINLASRLIFLCEAFTENSSAVPDCTVRLKLHDNRSNI